MLKFVRETAIYGIALPALVAGIAMLVAWRPWSDAERDGRWGAALGIPLAYLAAHLGLGGKPETMPYVLLGIAAVAAFEAFGRMETFPLGRTTAAGVSWALRVAAVPVITYVVAEFMFENYWTGIDAFLWPGLYTVAAVAAIGSLDAIGDRHRGATIPFVLMLMGTGGALVLALTGSARVGELLGALTASAGATLVVACWDGRVSLSRGGGTVFVLVGAALAIYGYTGLFGARQSVAARGLLALAASPHLLWFGEIEAVRDLGGWRAAAARVLVVAVAVGGTVTYVWMAAT